MAVPIDKGGVKAVNSGASSVTVTFASDDQCAASSAAFPSGYTVIIPQPTADWTTSITRGSVSVTAVTFNFGTAPGTGGGNLHWQAQGVKTS